MEKSNLPHARVATQTSFFLCGSNLSVWAAIIPDIKDRLVLTESELGILLLFLGLGAIIAMPLTGILINRIGSATPIRVGTLLLVVSLPTLAISQGHLSACIILTVFGYGSGMLDVAMNVHAMRVQNAYEKPVMSSFHGFYSIGGLFGALGCSVLYKIGINTLLITVLTSVLFLILAIWKYRKLADDRKEKAVVDSMVPVQKGMHNRERILSLFNIDVLLIGSLCFFVFLSEGAVLDWGSVFLRDEKGANEIYYGLGYGAFSIATAIVRFCGDQIIGKFGQKLAVSAGCAIAILGLTTLVISNNLYLCIFGFFLLGVGSANLVPIFFNNVSLIAKSTLSASLSIVTTIGYSGLLLGPVLLGLIGQYLSLSYIFIVVAILLFIVLLIYIFKVYKSLSSTS